MRTLSVLLLGLALCCLVACPAMGATAEEIVAQAAVVAAEQAVLDSLVSQGYADALQLAVDEDSLLTANGVHIYCASPHPLTGIRDNSGSVDVDIPYSQWDSATKLLWDARLSAAGNIDALEISTGRYLLHRTEVPALLELVRGIIAE